MEVIIFLGLILLLVVILTGNSRLGAQMRHMEGEISELHRQLKQFVRRQ